MQQEAADQKQVDMMVSFRSSFKQTAHDILGYWLCIQHADYSVGFTGECGGPNAVFKHFQTQKKNNENAPFKDIEVWHKMSAISKVDKNIHIYPYGRFHCSCSAQKAFCKLAVLECVSVWVCA